MNKKITYILLLPVVIMSAIVIYVTQNVSKTETDNVSGFVLGNVTATTTLEVIKIWGSEDDQLNKIGYLPKDIQYNNKTIYIEKDDDTVVEFGYAKLIHYEDITLRVYTSYDQTDGGGAPLIQYVTVDLKQEGKDWTQCYIGAIGQDMDKDSGYNLFLSENKVVTTTRSNVLGMGRTLGISVCDGMTEAKNITLNSGNRDTAVEADVDAEVKKIYANNDVFSQWLKGAIQEALVLVNTHAQPINQ